MAQEWAKSFYKSPAWKHNRRAYLDCLVDTDGHVVSIAEDGSFYWTDEYGDRVIVKGGSVVPAQMCERCFKMGKLVPAKVVHHIEWLNPQNINDPHIALSYANFMRLCQDCHAAVHTHEEESRVTFDEYGHVVWKENQ